MNPKKLMSNLDFGRCTHYSPEHPIGPMVIAKMQWSQISMLFYPFRDTIQ